VKTGSTHISTDKKRRALAPVSEVRGDELWYLVGASCDNTCVECVADHGRFLGWPERGKSLPVPERKGQGVFIAGREPTYLKKLEGLIRGLQRKGWSRIGLVANGVQLDKPGVAAAFKQLGLSEVRVKVFDLDPQQADAYASLDGAHEKSLKALRALNEHASESFQVRPMIVLHQGNIERSEAVFAYAASLSCDGSFAAVCSPELYRSLPPGDRPPLRARLKKELRASGGVFISPANEREQQNGISQEPKPKLSSDDKRLKALPIPEEGPKLAPPLREVPTDPEARWEFARSLTERMRCGDDLPFLDVDGAWTEPGALLETWAAFADRHKEAPRKRPVGIYAHMPYCTVKCSFCQDFAWALGSSSKLDDHVEGLLAEMEIFAPVMKDLRPVSFYFGGGTPSLLSPAHFERVFERLHDQCTFADDAQICVEGNPASFDISRARTLKALGVNRISMGVQALDPVVLRHINRAYQTHSMVAKAVEEARSVGMESLSLDLVAGLPGQSVSSFLKDTEFLADLGSDLLWLHPFNPEADIFVWTRRQLTREILRKRGEMIREADALLKSKGFERLFRMPIYHRVTHGYPRHFLEADRLAGSVMGFGWGAMSRCDGDVAYSTLDRERWKKAVLKKEGAGYFAEWLEPQDAQCRFLMFHLIEGIDRELYKDRFGQDVMADFGSRIKELSDMGYLEVREDAVLPLFDSWRDDMVTRRYLLSDRRLALLDSNYRESQWHNAGEGIELAGRTYDEFNWLPAEGRDRRDLRNLIWPKRPETK